MGLKSFIINQCQTKTKVVKAKSELSLFQVSEITVSYYSKFKACDRPKVSSSAEAYEILYNNWDLGKSQHQEQFKTLMLNNANRVIGISEIAAGGLAGVLADPKIIFSTALKANTCCLILAHNHPSGNLKPSEADIRITRKLVEGGKFLDLPVVDHLILTNDGYYSFGDEALI